MKGETYPETLSAFTNVTLVMDNPTPTGEEDLYANINNGCWKSPFSNEASRLSFEELFEQAKADACRMITEFFSGKDCREITENKSFLTGVEIE